MLKNTKTVQSCLSSDRRPGIQLSVWVLALVLAVQAIPANANLGCESAEWLRSPDSLRLSADSGSTRLQLEVSNPAILVIESRSDLLEIRPDACSAAFGGRVLGIGTSRRVLAFTDPGVFGLWVDGNGSAVEMRWIEAQAVPFEFVLAASDRTFFVHGLDLYSASLNDRRHLGQLLTINDSIGGLGATRAEIGMGIYQSSRSRSSRSRANGAKFVLKADIQIWQSSLPMGLGEEEDEEQEVDPNEGGFVGTKPVTVLASLGEEDEEQEVDPNEGGFVGTKPVMVLASLGEEDEEQEVDPNEGGFTTQTGEHSEHLTVTVSWSGASCDAPADRRALARQWIQALWP